MITEDEMIALLKAALNPRDKAFISLAFDIGPRPHEIGRLTIKDVKITEEGGTVTLPDRSKTGRRYVPIVFSIPYLYMWLRVHPLKGNKNAPLWVGLDKRTFAKPMMYPAIRKAILSVAKRANLEKRVHAYLFRHSSATHAAAHGSTEFQMDMIFGWVYGSKHPKTYLHMVGRDTKGAQNNRYGVKTKEEAPKSKLAPKICPRCEWFNEFDAKKCFKCGSSLDKTYALELERKKEVGEKALNELFQDDEVKDVIMKKLAEKPELIKQLLAS
jgi:ribosomal protein L40E